MFVFVLLTATCLARQGYRPADILALVGLSLVPALLCGGSRVHRTVWRRVSVRGEQ